MTTPEAPLNDDPSTPSPTPIETPKVRSSLAGGTWVALIFGILLLILLLVFILQNQQHVDLNLFTWSFSVPVGVGFLLAAIAGALIMTIVGGIRMLELRRQVKASRKATLNF
ncbi:LapA family protein [Corynebacterium sp. H130]|uniref:LapA family protein n=1 Tax=Corynebacterium sp. H130 TaxID=3133444 RepID=UPI003096D58A